VRFTLTNSGTRAGAEIAQVYLGFPSSTDEPPKRLVGWAKVELEPGESREVTVTIDPNSTSRPLSYWNVTRSGWEIASGEYTVYVGASSRNIPLTSTLRVHLPEKEERIWVGP
jgi:beta-glucosidase